MHFSSSLPLQNTISGKTVHYSKYIAVLKLLATRLRLREVSFRERSASEARERIIREFQNNAKSSRPFHHVKTKNPLLSLEVPTKVPLCPASFPLSFISLGMECVCSLFWSTREHWPVSRRAAHNSAVIEKTGQYVFALRPVVLGRIAVDRTTQ